jgi:uncharacterized protein (TIGR00661 family)
MKILYAIQGTGNGHLARAFDVIPALERHGEVEILISGNQADIHLPWPVKFQLHGLSFIFGEKGGVDIGKTISNMKLIRLLKDIKGIPVEEYDLVLNDFEPVTAWACKRKKIACIGISHQAAVLHETAPPAAKKDWLGKMILSYYAPVSKKFGFHFSAIDEYITTPVIRSDVRTARVLQNGHYTVYLPAYKDHTIIDFLSQFDSSCNWQIFSKHSKKAYKHGNMEILPVNKDAFTKSMITSEGVFCGAGFETPAESLFLKKKLCVIPMRNQYEQQLNASFLESMGIPVMQSLQDKGIFAEWLVSDKTVVVNYPDIINDFVDSVIYRFKNKAYS